MFVRTGATLLIERDCPNPNPRVRPFKQMAELTWLEPNGTTIVTYGCRRTFAQFSNRTALLKYVGKTFNGKDGKWKNRKKTANRATRKLNPITKADRDFAEGVARIITEQSRELAEWKARARKAEAKLETLLKAINS